jgi:hypothetical protein
MAVRIAGLLCGLAIASATALTGAQGMAAAGQGGTGPCPPPSARVLTAGLRGAVYATRDSHGRVIAYACANSARRSYALGVVPTCGSPQHCVGVDDEVLDVTVLAYQEHTSMSKGAGWMVVVRDLQTGRVLHRTPTEAGNLSGRQRGGGEPALALVVAENGDAAWATSQEGQPKVFAVHTLDATGDHVVASGTEIEPGSLALAVGKSVEGSPEPVTHGSVIYWTEAGKVFSVTLPG